MKDENKEITQLEDLIQNASDVQTTQGEAIERAKDMDPDATIHVERVRQTEGGNPDKWRKG